MVETVASHTYALHSRSQFLRFTGTIRSWGGGLICICTFCKYGGPTLLTSPPPLILYDKRIMRGDGAVSPTL